MTKKLQTTRRDLLRVAGVGAGLSLGGAGLLSEGVQLAEAKTSSSVQPWIIEDFEDGELSEYSFYFGKSNTSIATDPVYDGGHALKLTGDAKLFRPTFERAPTQGTTFSGRMRVSSGGPISLLTYGLQDKDNFYAARLRFDKDKLSILKKQNGKWAVLTSCPLGFSLQRDKWYELVVDWSENGTHTVTASGSGNTKTTAACTDSTWASGGIGFWCFAGSAGVLHCDYVVEKQRLVNGIEVEDFEDGNLTDYAIYYGNSATSVTSADSYTRDQSLRLADADVNMANVGISPAPVQGDTFSIRVKAASGKPISLFHYGVQDASQYYSLRLRHSTDEISLLKHDSGGWTELTGMVTDFDLTANIWYKFELDWTTDGKHVLTVSGDGHSASISCSDTTWASGGIGFMQYASAGDVTHFDSVQLEPVLGNYEVSNDDWTATGSSSITRKTAKQVPAAVTEGDQAIEVAINGEPHPSIESQERIAEANCSKNAYLLADVLPAAVKNSKSPVTFQFRYHHTNPGGVEKSPELTVDQSWGQTLAWDMSHLSDAKLSSPDHVEIAWYPTDHPPASGFTYNGRIVVDNVRLSSDLNEFTNARYMQKLSDLNRAHGMRTDTKITSWTEGVQKGVYKYPDGTEIPYTAEMLGNGVIEQTIDGTTLRWEGGSQ